MDKHDQTVIYRAQRKVAARYLLPTEMLLYVLLIITGMSGSYLDGFLAWVLAATGENAIWTLALTSVGAVGLGVCTMEWAIGRRWDNDVLLKSMTLRKWSAFFMWTLWLYVIWVLAFASPDGRKVFTVLASAPFAALFSAWAWWVAFRTQVVLSPSFHTSRLEERLEKAARTHWSA